MHPKSSKGRQGPRAPREKYSINDRINAPEVRLIGPEGEQLGVISTSDALSRAEEEGLDLVEVAPGEDPPVCRILDYGKLKYKEQKKAAESRKRGATHTVKEIRIRYRTEKHDLDTKIRAARKFLEAGDRVKFQMRFRGREVVYRDLGLKTFEDLAELLSDIAVIDEQTPLASNRMTITFAPRTAAKK